MKSNPDLEYLMQFRQNLTIIFQIALITSWLTVSTNPAFGQTFGGIVRDFETKNALPYANIGIVKKNIGCISDEGGAFRLDLSNSVGSDTVVISYVGYLPFKTIISKIDPSRSHTIDLKPYSQRLKEVVIRSKPEIITLGNKGRSGRHSGWGDFTSSRGRAIGVLIKTPDSKLKISKVVFHLNACEFDSARVRINLLKYEDGQTRPFEDQKENIFQTIHQKKGWIEVAMTEDIVVRNEEVIVAIEWVDAWAKTRTMDEGGSYLFTISLDNSRGSQYIRQTPEEPINLINSDFTPSIYLECFAVRE